MAASVKLAVPVGAPELIAADRFTVHVTRAEVTPRLLHVTLPTPVLAVATVAVTPAGNWSDTVAVVPEGEPPSLPKPRV